MAGKIETRHTNKIILMLAHGHAAERAALSQILAKHQGVSCVVAARNLSEAKRLLPRVDAVICHDDLPAGRALVDSQHESEGYLWTALHAFARLPRKRFALLTGNPREMVRAKSCPVDAVLRLPLDWAEVKEFIEMEVGP